MPRKKTESEKIEEKSQFLGDGSAWLRLVKTIVALANTKGGEMRLYNINGINPNEFDSARLDDKVNKYVEPRIQNICSSILKNYIKIQVQNSPSKPHVFTRDGAYQDPNEPTRQKNEFYKGQVLVRHSSKTEPATRDDYNRIFQEKSAEFMKRISRVFQLPVDKPVKIEEGPEALPIKLVKKGEGVPTILKRIDGKKGICVTNDLTAPVVRLEEKDLLGEFPLVYNELTKRLSKRYSNFKINHKYHTLRRKFEKNKKLCFIRYLDPQNPKSFTKKFYSLRIFDFFDNHYLLKKQKSSSKKQRKRSRRRLKKAVSKNGSSEMSRL